jgi:hypothetical protein
LFSRWMSSLPREDTCCTPLGSPWGWGGCSPLSCVWKPRTSQPHGFLILFFLQSSESSASFHLGGAEWFDISADWPCISVSLYKHRCAELNPWKLASDVVAEPNQTRLSSQTVYARNSPCMLSLDYI